MSTTKARLTLTLEPDLAAVIERLAMAQSCPRSRIVTEMLNELVPILEKVATTCELAMRAQKGAKEGIARAMDKAEAELAPMLAAVISAYDGLGQQIGDIAERIEGEGEGQRRDGAQPRRGALAPARSAASALTDPRTVTTGVTDTKRGAVKRPKPGGSGGCLCTYTKHERMENHACPVHFPGGKHRAL